MENNCDILSSGERNEFSTTSNRRHVYLSWPFILMRLHDVITLENVANIGDSPLHLVNCLEYGV